MIEKDSFSHIDYIKKTLDYELNRVGALEVGNNLNEYFTYEKAFNEYVNKLQKEGDSTQEKSSKDALMGRLAEETLIYLLESYFTRNKLDYFIGFNDRNNIKNTIKIVNEKLKFEKKFDIDIIVHNKKYDTKYFLISCKGSSRERIGQYLSNLFLMDDRLIKTKYQDRYFLDFHEKKKKIMYAFVCYDWSKTKDFVKKTSKGVDRKTIKQTEVFLINDDNYISGGITVLNNLENLDGIMNFGKLVGKISHFLN